MGSAPLNSNIPHIGGSLGESLPPPTGPGLLGALSTAWVFDRLWMRYDSWYERNRVLALNELRAVEALGLRGRGVEVGVGTGWFASRLGVEYGVDPSAQMLAVAKRRGVEAVQGVGERLPLRSSSLDYSLLIVTLCFVDNPLAVLEESARVVKPGGSVAACIVPRDSSWGRFYLERRRESPFYRVARFYTVDEVEEMMHRAGLQPRLYVSTLHREPWQEPQQEQPSLGDKSGGFVCIKAVKPEAG